MNRLKRLGEGADGIIKALARAKKLENFTVFRSENPDVGPWTPVYRDQVPEWLRGDPDVFAVMVAGNVVHNDTQGGHYYRAEKLEERKRGILIL